MGTGTMAAGRGTFGAMTDPDSLPAEPLSSGEAAAEDEAGADGIGDAVVVSFGQGIALDHGGDTDRSAGPPPDGLRPSAVAGQSVDAPDLSSDPMTMYLRDLSATPLLTREGEAALGEADRGGPAHDAGGPLLQPAGHRGGERLARRDP